MNRRSFLADVNPKNIDFNKVKRNLESKINEINSFNLKVPTSRTDYLRSNIASNVKDSVYTELSQYTNKNLSATIAESTKPYANHDDSVNNYESLSKSKYSTNSFPNNENKARYENHSKDSSNLAKESVYSPRSVPTENNSNESLGLQNKEYKYYSSSFPQPDIKPTAEKNYNTRPLYSNKENVNNEDYYHNNKKNEEVQSNNYRTPVVEYENKVEKPYNIVQNNSTVKDALADTRSLFTNNKDALLEIKNIIKDELQSFVSNRDDLSIKHNIKNILSDVKAIKNNESSSHTNVVPEQNILTSEKYNYPSSTTAPLKWDIVSTSEESDIALVKTHLHHKFLNNLVNENKAAVFSDTSGLEEINISLNELKKALKNIALNNDGIKNNVKTNDSEFENVNKLSNNMVNKLERITSDYGNFNEKLLLHIDGLSQALSLKIDSTVVNNSGNLDAIADRLVNAIVNKIENVLHNNQSKSNELSSQTLKNQGYIIQEIEGSKVTLADAVKAFAENVQSNEKLVNDIFYLLKDINNRNDLINEMIVKINNNSVFDSINKIDNKLDNLVENASAYYEINNKIESLTEVQNLLASYLQVLSQAVVEKLSPQAPTKIYKGVPNTSVEENNYKKEVVNLFQEQNNKEKPLVANKSLAVNISSADKNFDLKNKKIDISASMDYLSEEINKRLDAKKKL